MIQDKAMFLPNGTIRIRFRDGRERDMPPDAMGYSIVAQRIWRATGIPAQYAKKTADDLASLPLADLINRARILGPIAGRELFVHLHDMLQRNPQLRQHVSGADWAMVQAWGIGERGEYAFDPNEPRDKAGKWSGTNADSGEHSVGAALAEPSLVNKIKALPATTINRARSLASNLYVKTEAKYGPRWAKAIVATAIVTMPTPFTLASVAAMTGLAHLWTMSGRKAESFGREEMSDQEITAAAQELIAELMSDLDERSEYAKSWEESKHPRGQPENAGEFATTPGAGKNKSPTSQQAAAKNPAQRTAAKVTQKTPKSERTKSEIAKAAHVMVDRTIQRYAEEHNEPAFAKAMGGVSFPDSEAVDVAIASKGGSVAHGIELKTMVDNGNNKITMKRYPQLRKLRWEKANRATFHTVVLDDHAVFNANGEGRHDLSKRIIWYRRGVGSFRVQAMYRCKDIGELKRLMALADEQLPQAARRSDHDLLKMPVEDLDREIETEKIKEAEKSRAKSAKKKGVA